MYTLYYSPGRASLAIHWILIHLGVSFEARLIDFVTKAHKSPEYLRINPDGTVPTLVVGGARYFESAALALMLAERHPAVRLPAVDGLFCQYAAAVLPCVVLRR